METQTTTKRIPDINTVQSVYSGKANSCCCGCCGKHYYASKHVVAAGKNRGYEVTPDEVNDRMVKRVVNIINGIYDGTADGEKEFSENDFVSVVVGHRTYIAYFV